MERYSMWIKHTARKRCKDALPLTGAAFTIRREAK